MRRKTTWTSLILMIFLISLIPSVLAPPVPWTTPVTTKMNLYDAANPGAPWVDYPGDLKYVEITDAYEPKPGSDTFTIIANATDVTNCGSYAVGIVYNSSYFEVTSYTEGEFFYRVDAYYRTQPANLPALSDGVDLVDPTLSYAHVTWGLLLPGNVTGTHNGTLAEFTLRVKAYVVDTIRIITYGAKVAKLKDDLKVDIDFNIVDIMFDNTGLAPPAHGPTAKIDSITPPPPRFVGQTLTFTGANTSAEWGFSGLPDLVFYHIEVLEWDFGDTGADTGLSVTHAYSAAGDFTVNLTVTDENGGQDWVTTVVTIYEVPAGAVLDVMTQKDPYNGAGPYFPSSPFMAGKEELIQLYAKVLYNNCPVVNKRVTFSVYHIVGDFPLIAYVPFIIGRTADTDENGIAMIEYRTPTGWEDEFGEVDPVFAVYAYTFIAEGLVFDMLTYRVLWVCDIVSVEVDPLGTQPWYRGDPGSMALFNVTIECWDFESLPVVISLNLEDDLNVSIGTAFAGPVGRPPIPDTYWSPTRSIFGGTYDLMFFGEALNGPGTAWFLIGATIPRHAFVGPNCHAYVNLFDAWPIPDYMGEAMMPPVTGDGQPYCPEASVVFTIETCP